jgi:hypothetical protein
VAREQPQGSSGTQRNTKDGVNVNVFAKEDYLRRSLIYRYVVSQVIREYRDKTIRNVYRMSDETRGVEEDKNMYSRTNGPKSNIVRIWKVIVTPFRI